MDDSLSLLRHRGPDAQGTVDLPGVHLGHTRLRVHDLSESADQPMASARGDWILAFNGEIYNYREIAASLSQALRTSSDTEVVVEALSQWGIDEFLSRARGMFAFVAVNSRTRTVYLARDRFGEKPLYVAGDGQSLVAASELAPVVAAMRSRGRSLTADPLAVGEYLDLGYVGSPRTVLREVRRVRPGTYEVLSLDDVTPQPRTQQWASGWTVQSDGGLDSSDRAVERVLQQAVSEQLVADVPVGTFLSGGIDSSLVSLIASSLVPQGSLHTFSVGFSDPRLDETAWAHKVALRTGSIHHHRRMTDSDAERLIGIADQAFLDPIGDPSQLPTLFLSQLAREYVTVALTGDGADELFGGYARYEHFQYLRSGSAMKLREGLRGKTAWVRAGILSPRGLAARVRRARRASSADSLLEGYLPVVTYPRGRLGDVGIPVTWRSDVAVQHPDISNVADWARQFDVDTYLTDNILTKVDRSAMAFSLETRAPFLDARVAELARTIPASTLLSDIGGKSVLKRLVADEMGRDFVVRPKMGFGPPIGKWLRGPLRSWAMSSWQSETWDTLGLEPERIGRWVEDFVRGEHDEDYAVWSVLRLSRSFQLLETS